MTRREREILKASVSWTDKTLTVKEEKAFQAGAEWADKTMLDKVCKILENVTITYHKRFFGKCEENVFDADFIKEFRKLMEE